MAVLPYDANSITNLYLPTFSGKIIVREIELPAASFIHRNLPILWIADPKYQYAFANTTLLFEGLPDMRSTPCSSGASRGIHRMVALVLFLISSSVSGLPSQCA